MALIVGAVLSVCLIVAGVALVSVPAGLVVAGLSGLAGCYVVAYLRAEEGRR